MEAELSGGVTQAGVIVVVEAGDCLDRAADIERFAGVEEVFDGWVLGVATEDFFGFGLSGCESVGL